MAWRQIGFSEMIPHDIPVIIWRPFPEYQQQATSYRAIGIISKFESTRCVLAIFVFLMLETSCYMRLRYNELCLYVQQCFVLNSDVVGV